MISECIPSYDVLYDYLEELDKLWIVIYFLLFFISQFMIDLSRTWYDTGRIG
jgi:hypothetical protein